MEWDSIEPTRFNNNADSLNYIYKELLTFSDSTIISKFVFNTERSKWELDVANEIILFPKRNTDVRELQWDIKHVSESTLIVERMMIELVPYSNSYFEIVEFRKIK